MLELTLKGLETFLPVGVSPMVRTHMRTLSVAASDVNRTIKGNLVWRALKRHSASSWFAWGMTVFFEAVMSVTGRLSLVI